ncbi:hypothetical protein L1275_000493, partial [Flavobacterium sp. HSC-61S13]|nr:hypothetical protein [Flavobacterium sp. HSC-61S13]
MKKNLLSIAFLMGAGAMYAQVGIGTTEPNKSTQLEIVSKDRGVLIPQVALNGTGDVTSISNGNVNSLLVFNINKVGDVVPGYYYWMVDRWVRLQSSEDVVPTPFSLTALNYDPVTNTLSYTNGLGTVIDYILKNTTNTSLTFANGNLKLTDSYGNSVDVDISSIDTNNINSSLVVVGNDLVLTDNKGIQVKIPLSSIDKNTTNASLALTNGDLILIDTDGKALNVNLSSIDTNTTNSTLTVADDKLILTDSDGNMVDVLLNTIDTNNINATLAVVGTNLVLTDNKGVAV